MKKVPVTFIIETEIEVLDDFDKHDIDFHLNDSSHCLDNDIADLYEELSDRCTFCDRVVGLVGHHKEEIEQHYRFARKPQESH